MNDEKTHVGRSEVLNPEEGNVRGDNPAPSVTPEDYGTSWQTTDEEGAGGCFALGFAALSAVVLIVWLLVHLLGTQ
jgi:hypothetical protein